MSLKSKMWIVAATFALFWVTVWNASAAPTIVPTKLAWDLTTDPTVAGFRVYSYAPGAPAAAWKTVKIENPVATEWGFHAATPFTSPTCFRVTSFTANDQYESAYSDEVCASFFVLPQSPKNVRVQ